MCSVTIPISQWRKLGLQRVTDSRSKAHSLSVAGLGFESRQLGSELLDTFFLCDLLFLIHFSGAGAQRHLLIFLVAYVTPQVKPHMAFLPPPY